MTNNVTPPIHRALRNTIRKQSYSIDAPLSTTFCCGTSSKWDRQNYSTLRCTRATLQPAATKTRGDELARATGATQELAPSLFTDRSTTLR